MCYPDPVLITIPRNFYCVLGVLLHFMEKVYKVPQQKKIKRQSPKGFRVERGQCPAERKLRGLQESL